MKLTTVLLFELIRRKYFSTIRTSLLITFFGFGTPMTNDNHYFTFSLRHPLRLKKYTSKFSLFELLKDFGIVSLELVSQVGLIELLMKDETKAFFLGSLFQVSVTC